MEGPASHDKDMYLLEKVFIAELNTRRTYTHHWAMLCICVYQEIEYPLKITFHSTRIKH